MPLRGKVRSSPGSETQNSRALQQLHSQGCAQNDWNQGLKQYLYPMVAAALFTAAKRGSKPVPMTTHEGDTHMWRTHTMQRYPAVQRKETPTHATWMDLANTVLSELH